MKFEDDFLYIGNVFDFRYMEYKFQMAPLLIDCFAFIWFCLLLLFRFAYINTKKNEPEIHTYMLIITYVGNLTFLYE